MRYLIALLVLFVLGCEDDNHSVNRKLYLPLSAQILYIDSTKGTSTASSYEWVFWKYRGSCYLSGHMLSSWAVMTKTDCPKE